MHTKRVWNNLHQVRSKSKRLENQIILKVLGVSKPKGLNSITKIDQGHLCLREENLNSITKIDQGHLCLREENLNSITKIDQGHLCLREENLSFNNKINQIFCDTYKTNFTNYTRMEHNTKRSYWKSRHSYYYTTFKKFRIFWKNNKLHVNK